MCVLDLKHEIGCFNRDNEKVRECIKDLLQVDSVKQGVGIGSVISDDKALDLLSDCPYPIYATKFQGVPVVVFAPTDAVEYYDAKYSHCLMSSEEEEKEEEKSKSGENIWGTSKEVFEFLVNKHYMVILLSLTGDVGVCYEGFSCHFEIKSLVAYNVLSCLVQYPDKLGVVYANVFGGQSGENSKYSAICMGMECAVYDGLDSDINKTVIQCKDNSVYYKVLYFLSHTILYKSLDDMFELGKVVDMYAANNIFFRDSLVDLSSVVGYTYKKDVFVLTAKDLPKLLLKACLVDKWQELGNFDSVVDYFCHTVPDYASFEDDFKRPYKICNMFFVDGNLSVDRALTKARNAAIRLGLNPFEFGVMQVETFTKTKLGYLDDACLSCFGEDYDCNKDKVDNNEDEVDFISSNNTNDKFDTLLSIGRGMGGGDYNSTIDDMFGSSMGMGGFSSPNGMGMYGGCGSLMGGMHDGFVQPTLKDRFFERFLGIPFRPNGGMSGAGSWKWK